MTKERYQELISMPVGDMIDGKANVTPEEFDFLLVNARKQINKIKFDKSHNVSFQGFKICKSKQEANKNFNQLANSLRNSGFLDGLDVEMTPNSMTFHGKDGYWELTSKEC